MPRRFPDPEARRKHNRDYYASHKEEQKQRVRLYKEKHGLRMRAKQYGLTEQEYLDMYDRQNGLCAICQTEEAKSIDHSHATGEVRGLLCGQCNLLLGIAKDSPLILKSAARYLTTLRIP